MPTEISSPLHFRTLLTGTSYLIADFYATWCPPCKAIAPLYTQLADAHGAPSKIAFVKVNVDEQREVAAQYGIRAMPTFLVFKEGKVVEEVKGADAGALRRVVKGMVEGVKVLEAEKRAREEKKVEKEGKEGKKEEGKGEENTVSGSYGMTGGSHWKMSLT